jgi:hypothetical protein
VRRGEHYACISILCLYGTSDSWGRDTSKFEYIGSTFTESSSHCRFENLTTLTCITSKNNTNIIATPCRNCPTN